MLRKPLSAASRSVLSIAAATTVLIPTVSAPAQAHHPSTYASPVRQGRVAYVPAGMTLTVTLTSSISSQVARPGDQVTATLGDNVYLGSTVIPAGSVVTGHITDAEPGKRLARSGLIGIKFTRLRTPGGVDVPITAHIVGGIGKYKEIGSDTSDLIKGEGAGTKVTKTLVHGAVGAGSGALLGTAIGAIAGRSGRSVGRGAWSGAAIGGGVGVAHGLLIRKGKDVTVPSGTRLQIQFDAPASLPAPVYGTL